ncbi:MAG: hypothetical protein EP319_08925 [Deltaproteobacteria bacterium]|nr:MAG: hypothetical protein EP319_08925 [Deltaproteobacteria bacterium]
MKNLLLLLTAAIFFGCGQAKTIYADQKYGICMEKCNMKYSKYDSANRSKCISECNKSKYEDAK